MYNNILLAVVNSLESTTLLVVCSTSTPTPNNSDGTTTGLYITTVVLVLSTHRLQKYVRSRSGMWLDGR